MKINYHFADEELLNCSLHSNFQINNNCNDEKLLLSQEVYTQDEHY